MKRILIIGPSPQNIGGVSIHIKRLIELLKEEYIFDLVDEGHKRYKGVFNLRSLNLITYFIKVLKADVIHIQSGVAILRMFHIIVCRFMCKKKTIITIHRDLFIESWINVTISLLKKCDHILFVNRQNYDSIQIQPKNKKHHIPAFLPPTASDEQQLPEMMTHWIREVKKNCMSMLMVSNAWNLILNSGEDLYGLDICIKAMERLKKHSGKYHYYLIFVVASSDASQELMMMYKKDIEYKGLSSNILIWESPVSFIRLIKESNVVLRTTNTDGDAISVREALFYNKLVIASDVSERPNSVITFKNRDVNDLINKILESTENEKSRNYIADQISYKEIYTNIYQ